MDRAWLHHGAPRGSGQAALDAVKLLPRRLPDKHRTFARSEKVVDPFQIGIIHADLCWPDLQLGAAPALFAGLFCHFLSLFQVSLLTY